MGPVALLAMVIPVALFIGVAAAVLPAKFTLALLFLPVFLIVAWTSPVTAFLALIAVIYGVLPAALVPQLPIGGGRFQASDLALLGLLAAHAVRFGPALPSIWRSMRPVLLPVGGLLLLAVVSFAVALLYFQNPAKHVLAEARYFLYWLVLPLALAVASSDERRYRAMTLGLLVIAYLISTGLVVQHLTGIDLLGGGRTEALITLDQTSDVTRTTSPGIFLVVFAILYLLARWLSGRVALPWAALLVMPLVAGLLVTFGRAVWFAALVGALVVAASMGWRAFARFLLVGSLLSAVLFATLWVVRPQTAEAVVDRATSIRREVSVGSSFEWRVIETQHALKNIARNPLIGVGLGGFNHPSFHARMDENLRRYVHNGYLYLAVKLGLVSLVLLALLIWRCLVWLHQDRQAARAGPAQAYPERRAYLGAFMAVVVAAFTQPQWMYGPGVAFVALMLAMVLASQQLERQVRA
ncbi:MAG: O-antigen ligase family protein [Pseudomonadota bacterium]